MDDLCPACGSSRVRATRLHVDTDRRYTVHRCLACRLAFTAPRPTPAQLAEFYQDSYFNRPDPGSAFGYSDYDGGSLAAVNAARTWDDLAAWAPMTRNVEPRTLLDIGAATGEFGARAHSDGWTVTACELGDSARAKAAAKGLATVADLDDADGPFGLITMFHVLEHAIDPAAMLERCRDLIHLGGLLAIELPQWRSAGRIIRRSRWAQLRPPEHINFFTRRSLTAVLESTGWEPVYAATPYPRAGELARAAAGRRDVKDAARQSARLAVGAAGFGGYLRAVARPC